jgi:hypothetical protein
VTSLDKWQMACLKEIPFFFELIKWLKTVFLCQSFAISWEYGPAG